VASAYDFAGHLLASQRKFAENVIEATKPLLGAKEGPAHGEGPVAREGGTKRHQIATPHAPRAGIPRLLRILQVNPDYPCAQKSVRWLL
jgi:hypothetical protein